MRWVTKLLITIFPYIHLYLVHFLDVIVGDLVGDVLGKVLLVLGLVFLSQVLHVLRDVCTVDAVTVHLRLTWVFAPSVATCVTWGGFVVYQVVCFDNRSAHLANEEQPTP